MKIKKYLSMCFATITLFSTLNFPANAASSVKGDANGDSILNVRDAAFIASRLSSGLKIDINADFNEDGTVNVRDAAAIANKLSSAANTETVAEEMLRLVNAERAKAGVSPLRLNETMNTMADIRAQELTINFSHTRPDGTSCFTVFDDFNMSYKFRGENIAAGKATVADTVEQWVNSEGHYKNMIKAEYTELGIGFSYEPDVRYNYFWVQIFR